MSLYGFSDCAFRYRGRTAELAATGGRWLLSVCYRKATAAATAAAVAMIRARGWHEYAAKGGAS